MTLRSTYLVCLSAFRSSVAAPIFAAAALSFALAGVGTAADGWPLPRAFDEFSYLLAGETFANGRLTNPPYALPEAVETIHVLQQPTYSSKYLPGHGLFLATGSLLAGSPRFGQWLAFACMGGALIWMLSAWLSRRTAFLAMALFVLVLADTDWASGYWGSSEAVAGSALIFGAIGRLRRAPRVALGVVTGAGALLLALTRPLEGLAVCVFPAGYLAWWVLFANRAERKLRVTRFALPCALVLTLGMTFLAAHNKSVTGDALRLPYTHYEKGAAGAPPFIWQSANTPHEELRANEQARIRIDLGSYNGIRENWLASMWARASAQSLGFYLPHAVFALVLLLLPFAWRRRSLWLVAASATAVGIAIGTSSFYLPHYLAPALPPLLVLYAVSCGVATRMNWSGHRIGRAAIVGLTITFGAFGVWGLFSHTPLEEASSRPHYWTRQRDAIAQGIKAQPGKHVVFVRYAPTYNSQNEWVQNGANLSLAPVLWVHDLGEPTNSALRQLEVDRTAWVVTVHGGARPPELQRYDADVTVAGAMAR
jgi:hypothetical protein